MNFFLTPRAGLCLPISLTHASHMPPNPLPTFQPRAAATGHRRRCPAIARGQPHHRLHMGHFPGRCRPPPPPGRCPTTAATSLLCASPPVHYPASPRHCRPFLVGPRPPLLPGPTRPPPDAAPARPDSASLRHHRLPPLAGHQQQLASMHSSYPQLHPQKSTMIFKLISDNIMINTYLCYETVSLTIYIYKMFATVYINH
jgi:hypothetical protein